MFNTVRRIVIGTFIAAAVAAAAAAGLDAQGVKITDPTSVVMIVNRDSNDIGFMDIKTKKMIGNVFLGNNVNPHMVMMSPDGRYVVTGGTRANKAFIIDTRTLQLVKVIPTDIAPEHLAFSPDSRWYYQGNPDGDSISVIDMQSLSKIKTIPGFVEPLNVTFLPDGSKAYIGNYGAHWVGVIDVRRHELLKKIQIGSMPAVSKLDPAKYLGEIKGINIAAPSIDGRYLYAADSDLAIVAVIDTREDKVIKTIRVGRDPWRIYMSHDGKYGITINNGDETISIIDTRSNTRRGDARGGPGHDRHQLRRRQGLRHQLDERLRLRLRHVEPEAGRAHRIGTNIQLETATTDAQDRKIYLAESTNHEVVIIDSMDNSIERVQERGPLSLGHAHHG